MKKHTGIFRKIILGTMAMVLASGAGYAINPQSAVSVAYAAEIKYEVDGNTIHLKNDMVEKYGLDVCMAAAAKYATENADGTIKYSIKIPAGTYDLAGPMQVGNGVDLDLTDVTLVAKMASGNMLILDYAHDIKGYGDGKEGNVIVRGGTFIGNDNNSSSMIRMAHAQNVTFENCTLVGGGCAHQMEVASIDGFVVENCVFRDAKGNGTNEKQEALQIDIPCSKYVFKSVELDGTPMNHVTITGCTFKNVLRGLGTHSMLVGAYHENIAITNNTFENVDGECIVGLNYKNCTITGNVMNNCGAGILFQNFKPGVKAVYSTIYDGVESLDLPIDNNANVTISNNTITLASGTHPDEAVGIKVYGYELKKDTHATGIGSGDLIAKGDFGVEGVTIKNNSIKTNGHGIHLLHVSNAQISGNKINNTNKKSDKDGIFAEFNCKNLVIDKNQIENASRYGIFMKDSSTAKKISGNKIKGAGSFGIGLYEGSQVTGAITSNTVLNTKAHGISISKKCYAKEISKNTVKGCKEYPIFVNTTARKKILVKNNKLQAGKNKKKIVIMNGNVKVQ